MRPAVHWRCDPTLNGVHAESTIQLNLRTTPMKRTITVSLAAAFLAAATITGSAAAARPDVGCMQAGIKTLQSARLLDDVARGGIAIATAVSLGVTVRPGADISGVPNPIPFSMLLADHRAGDNSAFVYPWC